MVKVEDKEGDVNRVVSGPVVRLGPAAIQLLQPGLACHHAQSQDLCTC